MTSHFNAHSAATPRGRQAEMHHCPPFSVVFFAIPIPSKDSTSKSVQRGEPLLRQALYVKRIIYRFWSISVPAQRVVPLLTISSELPLLDHDGFLHHGFHPPLYPHQRSVHRTRVLCTPEKELPVRSNGNSAKQTLRVGTLVRRATVRI